MMFAFFEISTGNQKRFLIAYTRWLRERERVGFDKSL